LFPRQLTLPPTLPTSEGNVSQRLFREQMLIIDHQLKASALEDQFIQRDLEQWLKQNSTATAKDQQRRQLHAHRALRCNIARTLLNEDFRAFAAHSADSQLLQHFCGLSTLAC